MGYSGCCVCAISAVFLTVLTQKKENTVTTIFLGKIVSLPPSFSYGSASPKQFQEDSKEREEVGICQGVGRHIMVLNVGRDAGGAVV